jgi:hypothetical protein
MGQAEWAGRAQFAEVAEAVSVPTDHVVGVQRALIVTFTTGFEPDDDFMLAVVAANPVDGVLQVMNRRVLCTVGEWDRDMRRSLDELLGEPLEDGEDA